MDYLRTLPALVLAVLLMNLIVLARVWLVGRPTALVPSHLRPPHPKR